MRILALDSAASSCNLCLWDKDKVLAQTHEAMERGQDQRIVPLVLDLLQQASLTFNDLDRIAVTRGPGSFTGLRIGLAAARGMGLAADKPVIGIDRFSIYRAQVQQPDKNLLVVIQSKRQELFCGFYPAYQTIAMPMMMTQDEIFHFLVEHPQTLTAGEIDALPAFVAATESEVVTCARLAAQSDAADPAFLPRPLYIRPPDVTIKTASAS